MILYVSVGKRDVSLCSTLRWVRLHPAQDHSAALFKHQNTPGVLMLLQSRNCWAQTSSPQACSPTDGLVLPLQNSSSSALSCCFLRCQKCRPCHWTEQKTKMAEPGWRQELSVEGEHFSSWTLKHHASHSTAVPAEAANKTFFWEWRWLTPRQM